MNGYAPTHRQDARSTVEQLAASKIREVANAAMGLPDVIPLWFGEPDAVTPAFICEAAAQGLRDGLTFYGPNMGTAELRESIAAYSRRLGRRVDSSQVAVTASGVNALMLASQALLEPGDRVVVITPHWPNIGEIPRVMNAQVQTVALRLLSTGWTLDVNELLQALTPTTRLLIVNAPANPTGWVMSRADQVAVLEHCRRHGSWIVADDVYERIVFDAPVSPSFLDIAEPGDRVVSINSFSKTWAMTGWRLGWITAPPALMPSLAKLIEFNISCTPAFVQRAGIAAIEQGEDFVRETVARYRARRDTAAAVLAQSSRLSAALPAGAMYLFTRVEGCTDSMALAKDILQHQRVGLAPGIAFGPAGEGCLRICVAVGHERLVDACERVVAHLASA